MTDTLQDKPPAETTPVAATPMAPPGPRSTPTWPPAWPVEARFAAWVMVAAGVFFRICKWAHWRSLWTDELFLSHSILTRGFWDLLFKPLDTWQAAPAGFLFLERLSVDCLGGGERVLRLPSLLAGLASLPLFYAVARRVLQVRSALMAVLLFTCLSPLIYYSQETKQYSSDVAVTLAIFLTALNVWNSGPKRRPMIWYAAVGGIGVFFSHPAIFVLAGTSLALVIGGLVMAPQRGESRGGWVAGMALAAVVPGLLELVNYWLFLRPTLMTDARQGLIAYWKQPGQNGFLAYGPHDILPWIWWAFWRIIHEPGAMNINNAGLAMMAAIVGIAALYMGRRRAGLFLILSPIPFALVASALKRYPFADRLALYMVPMIVLLIAAGLDWIWGDHSMGRAMVAMLMLVMLCGSAAFGALDEIHAPNQREETEQVYNWIYNQWHPGDMLVLCPTAPPSFDYYAPKIGLTGLKQLPFGPPEQNLDPQLLNPIYNKAFVAWRHKPAPPPVEGYVCVLPDRSRDQKQGEYNDQCQAGYLWDADNLCDPPASWHWPAVKRIWLVYTHSWDRTGFQPETITLPEIDRHADRIGGHEEYGATVYLYQLNTPEALPSAHRP